MNTIISYFLLTISMYNQRTGRENTEKHQLWEINVMYHKIAEKLHRKINPNNQE